MIPFAIIIIIILSLDLNPSTRLYSVHGNDKGDGNDHGKTGYD
jgi:hypothetical protein